MQSVPDSPEALDFVTERRTTRVVFGAGSFWSGGAGGRSARAVEGARGGHAGTEEGRRGPRRPARSARRGRARDRAGARPGGRRCRGGARGGQGLGRRGLRARRRLGDRSREGDRPRARGEAQGHRGAHDLFRVGDDGDVGADRGRREAHGPRRARPGGAGHLRPHAHARPAAGRHCRQRLERDRARGGSAVGPGRRAGDPAQPRRSRSRSSPGRFHGSPRRPAIPGRAPRLSWARTWRVSPSPRPRWASTTRSATCSVDAGLPHAETHAALLPHVVRFNRDAAPEAMARIARALGAPDAIAGVFALAAATGAPSGLARLGLAREAIDDVVRAVLAAAPPNPRPLDERSLRNLLLDALEERTTSLTLAEQSGRRHPTHRRLRRGDGIGGPRRRAPAHAERAAEVSLRPLPGARERRAVHDAPRGEHAPLALQDPAVDAPRRARAPAGGALHGHASARSIPNRIRWRPLPIPQEKIDFLDGMHTLGGLGDPAGGPGYAVHLYAASADMGDRCFTNSDGDMLIVPQEGTLVARTECGVLRVAPGEVLLVPRGLKLTIDLPDGRGRGYVGEVFGVALPPPRARPHRIERPRGRASLRGAQPRRTRTAR